MKGRSIECKTQGCKKRSRMQNTGADSRNSKDELTTDSRRIMVVVEPSPASDTAIIIVHYPL